MLRALSFLHSRGDGHSLANVVCRRLLPLLLWPTWFLERGCLPRASFQFRHFFLFGLSPPLAALPTQLRPVFVGKLAPTPSGVVPIVGSLISDRCHAIFPASRFRFVDPLAISDPLHHIGSVFPLCFC